MYRTIQTYLSESNLKRVCYFLITIGIIYRLVLWWQNRGMFIDEANLARNIYERNFLGLTKPLFYEQFAPPVFLWMSKISTLVFGYDERAFRLYPFITSIAALWLFYKVAKEYITFHALWYPLALFATGALYLRYATEFKQYMPDAFMALSLIYVALKLDILQSQPIRFIIIWIVLGSVAIWSSMPSVFILAAIGVYYFVITWLSNQKTKIIYLIFIGSNWLLQFGFYFFSILKNQMNSSYLQNFHQWYFLDAFPTSIEQFKSHNYIVLKGLTEVVGGKIMISLVLNTLLTLLGWYYLIRTKNKKAILLMVPGILVLIASAAKSYSIMERLMLFCIPCWLIIIGVGLDYILNSNITLVRVLCILFALIGVIKFNKISYLTTRPLQLEAVNQCLDFLVDNKITAKDLYIHNLASGGYNYYVYIHPDKNKWKSLRNANQLKWDTNIQTLFSNTTNRSALLTTSMGDGVYAIWEDIKLNNTIVSTSNRTDAKAVIFSRK